MSALELVEPPREAGVSVAGIHAAARRIAGVARRTPLLECDDLNARTGGRILLKAEVLQPTGSFKFRCAYNRLAAMTPAERARGVLAWSSGNHGQAVALAAKMFGTRAVIVTPADTPQAKAARMRELGAEIVTYDRYSQDREEVGRPIAERHGYALAPSYDDYDVIEGAGTCGLEIVEQAAEAGLSPDAFLICCGGGALSAGCATVLSEVAPSTEVWLAEPEGFDETWASVRTGVRQRADITRRTICDAIATPTPGRLTLPILERLATGGVSLSEVDVLAAMEFAFRRLRLVVEPGGAVALAAVLSGRFDARGRIVAVTLTGGNVDPAAFARALAIA